MTAARGESDMANATKESCVFKADFSHDRELDPAIWTIETGDRWANNEQQIYVDDKEHLFIENGVLTLRATRENKTYRSTRINTFNTIHFRHGRFLFRAKMPKGRGSWPAIWLLGTSVKKGLGWPRCGEIDILEYAGNRPKTITSALHTNARNHRRNNERIASVEIDDLSDRFHDYVLLWTKDRMRFSIDGKELVTFFRKAHDGHDVWPFDDPFYLIINLAVGGWYGGPIADEDFPFDFQIAKIEIHQFLT